MKLSDGQKFLLGAVGVSLVAHFILILVIRPYAMTDAATYWRRSKAKRSQVRHVTFQPPKAPVAAQELPAEAAVRQAPAAEAQGLKPADAALAESESVEMISLPSVELPAVSSVPVTIPDAVPRFTEVYHVEADSPILTPVTPTDALAAVAAAAAVPDAGTAPAPKLEVAEALETAVPVPIPALEESGAGIGSELMSPTYVRTLRPKVRAVEAKSAPEFTPPEQVMEKINESVVEAEKAAVRKLLDEQETEDLVRFVKIDVAAADDGPWTYFRLTVRPLDSLGVVPKDVVILMDASGSIANDRLRNCRNKAKEILRTCMNTGDRFNLVAFRDSFEYASRSWLPCNKASYDYADRWMNNLAAHGRTDVFATIASVLKLPRNPRRPLVALVVTDGEANSGVSETAEIISRFSKLNDGLISVYMYGVKGSANRELLDSLTRANRGESYIFTGDRTAAGSKIDMLSERFRSPVLSDLRVVFSAATPADAYPRLLRNLHQGDSVELIGRTARGTQQVTFSVKGLNGASAYEGVFTAAIAPGRARLDRTLPARWEREQMLDARLH